MLNAISPIDGRYHQKTKALADYFSEYALIKYRVFVEIQYFIALAQYPLPQLNEFNLEMVEALNEIFENFSQDDALQIKKIERDINHDVKAVEYFLKDQFDELEISHYKEFIHFGLTSQDINNTAIPLLIKNFLEDIFYPQMNILQNVLISLSNEWANVPMLARTHGQPATPTLLGKELKVFIERLQVQIDGLKQIEIKAKFGGATGNFNAHMVAYPAIDWRSFGNHFVEEYLGLNRSQYTTQIAHYDTLAAIFQNIGRINTVLIDMCRDLWTYVSMDYFKQKINEGEVGSSAMPHKVNPIDFENAEGNLGVANAIFQHLASKLPISRLQRDLTDSTVTRNIGVPFGHTIISIKSILRGLDKLVLNEEKLATDLEANWMVVAEAIQNILRRESYENPYEILKELTRGKSSISRTEIHLFIDQLDLEDHILEELKAITPHNYVGLP